MMVNCLKCKSKINDTEAWKTTCRTCKNHVAICDSCMVYYSNVNYPYTIQHPDCCKINKDYKIMSNS